MLMGSCVLYPQYLFAFQLLVCLEVAGCWSNQYRYGHKSMLWCRKHLLESASKYDMRVCSMCTEFS